MLIFSPGRGGYRANSTCQLDELVAQCCIVVGIDHPSTVADAVFPDGRHVKLDDRVAAPMLDQHIAEDSFMLTVFGYLGQDAVFTLNQLSALNTADPNQTLTGRLDLQHVGILGTSLGGTPRPKRAAWTGAFARVSCWTSPCHPTSFNQACSNPR